MIERNPKARAAAPSQRRLASQQRRRCILAAAKGCFGERGFAGATVETIARRAGVSNGLLYRFFRSKEVLFQVVLEEVVADWVRALVPHRDAKLQTASEKLEAMLRRSVAFCRKNPLLPALFASDPQLGLERIEKASANRIQPHRELVASILREGIQAGELRPDLDVPAVADVICQLQAHYSSRVYKRDPRFPASPRIVDAVAELIREALRAR